MVWNFLTSVIRKALRVCPSSVTSRLRSRGERLHPCVDQGPVVVSTSDLAIGMDLGQEKRST